MKSHVYDLCRISKLTVNKALLNEGLSFQEDSYRVGLQTESGNRFCVIICAYWSGEIIDFVTLPLLEEETNK